MTKHIKQFANHAAYVAFTQSEAYVLPNVSHCIQEDEMHYSPSGRLQDGFYFVACGGDWTAPGEVYSEAGNYEGSTDIEVTWQTSLDDGYLTNLYSSFDIYAVKNGQWVPAENITVTDHNMSSADGGNIELTETEIQEDFEQYGMTHTLNLTGNIYGLSPIQIMLSCPEFNHTLSITIIITQPNQYTAGFRIVDDGYVYTGSSSDIYNYDYDSSTESTVYLQGTVANLSRNTIKIPIYYSADGTRYYTSSGTITVSNATSHLMSGVTAALQDASDTDYQVDGVSTWLTLNLSGLTLESNPDDGIVWQDFYVNGPNNQRLLVSLNGFRIPTSSGSGGSGSFDSVEFTSESSSNYQYYIDNNGPRNGGTWQTSVICPSGTLQTYTDHDVPLDGFSQTKNGWTISFSTAYDSTTSNSLGTSVYTVTTDIQKVGNVVSALNYDFVISACSSDSNIAGIVQWELSSPEEIYS